MSLLRVCALALLVGLPRGSAAGSFELLPLFPSAISADGRTIVGTAPGGIAAYWRRDTGLVPLHGFSGPEAFNSGACCISADGQVIAATANARNFFWTESEGPIPFGPETGFSVSDLSGDASIVTGSRFDSGFQEAARWSSDSGLVGLGELPGGAPFSAAADISASGSVIVGTSASTRGREPFLWTAEGGMVGLGNLPHIFAYYGGANAISLDGSTVVGFSHGPGGVQAFRWTAEGGMVALGDIPGAGFGSVARDVSADGSVVVGGGDIPEGDLQRAFIWTEAAGMRALADVLALDHGLDLLGMHLSDVYGISADGRTLVGRATGPSGPWGFLAILPEVSAPGLVALAWLSLLGSRRRSR